MNRRERLTDLGRALGIPGRRPDLPPVHFRVEQSKLDAERDAAALVIAEAIERYQHRFSRIERARSIRRRAERRSAL
jgi:hypothetical protein